MRRNPSTAEHDLLSLELLQHSISCGYDDTHADDFASKLSDCIPCCEHHIHLVDPIPH